MKSKELKKLNCILDRYINKTNNYDLKDLTYDLKYDNISIGKQILNFITTNKK